MNSSILTSNPLTHALAPRVVSRGARMLSLAAIAAACFVGSAEAASTVTFSLVPSDTAAKPGELIDVVVHLGVSTPIGETAPEIIGAQFAVNYDTTQLTLEGGVEISPTLPWIMIPEATPAGEIVFALLSFPTIEPLDRASADVATLHFRVNAGASACATPALVSFDLAAGLAGNNVGLLSGDAPAIALSNLPAVTLDGIAPTLGVVPLTITVPTDAGSTYGAAVAEPSLTPADNCDANLDITSTVTLAGIPGGSAWPTQFPIGTSTVQWTATDDSGNFVVVTQTITVEPYQLLDVSVHFPGEFSRQAEFHNRWVRIKMGAYDAVHAVEIDPSTQAGSLTDLHVPVAASYSCACAKDTTHSLSDSALPAIVGTEYAVSFELLQGDSNNDDFVDVIDFSYYVVDFGPANASGRSNFNGDGNVTNADFAFISINFWKQGETCGGAATGNGPRARVSVKELRRAGNGQLAAADLNGDGWIDVQDIAHYLEHGVATVKNPEKARGQGW